MKTSTATRKPGRPADPALWERRREEILETAASLFARHGYSETDTQVLADKLGVGKGTLYRYFPSKRELFLATVDRVMRKLGEQINACVEEVDDSLEQVTRAVRTYIEFFDDNPDFVELLIQERAQFRDRKKPTYFEHRDANAERWRGLYRALIADGRVRNVPVDRIRDVISQLLYGTMFTNYFTGRQKPADEQARDILDIFFNGILTDGERRRRNAS